jgi:GrpB-like predicted nucleotidyltransferase (UPF0157 family)
MKGVRVDPYDERWPRMFEDVRDELAAGLGPAARAIHHIGSTSVPGLDAKPVIDVLVEAAALEEIDALSAAIEALGYEARGEYGIPGRRYFSRPPGEGLKVHVHAYRTGDDRLARHLGFRDALRRTPATVHAYGALKRRLARRHANDAAAYQAGKAAFITRVQEQAGVSLSDGSLPPA